MKQISFLITGIALLFFISCGKENIKETSTFEGLRVQAYIDNDEVKTTYNNETDFSWGLNDRIGVQIVGIGENAGAGYNRWNFEALSATSSSAFAGAGGTSPSSEIWTYGEHAFYPKDTGVGADLSFTNAANPQVTLSQTYTQNMSNPMKYIPLIGTHQGEGVYKFKTATGILKLTFENVPSCVDYVFIDHGGANYYYALSGTFTLESDGYTISDVNVVGDTYGTKRINISGVSNGDTFSVYVPVPVGTIPASELTISLHAATLGNIAEVVNPEAIQIKRGVIVETPSISTNLMIGALAGRYRIGTSDYYITLSELSGTDDTSKGNIKISRYERTTIGSEMDLTGVCYGTYDATSGSITFPLYQQFADTSELISSQPVYWSFRSYSYGDAQLVLSVNSDGSLASNNLWFDKLQTPYTAGYYNQSAYHFTSPTLYKQ